MTPKKAIIAEMERLGWLTNPESTGYAYVNMIEANALAAAVVGALLDHGYTLVGPTEAKEVLPAFGHYPIEGVTDSTG